MKRYWLKCIFLQISIMRTTLAAGYVRGTMNSRFANKKILSTALETAEQKSIIKCSEFCHRTSHCLSCAYNDDTKQCMLYGEDFITDVEYEKNWNHYWIVPLKGNIISQTSCTQYPDSDRRPCSLFCMKYVSHSTDISIDAAEAECAGMNGDLVRVDRELKQFCVEKLLGPVSDGEVLIQGRKIDGVWRYNDGTEITFFKWNTVGGQPSNGQNEDHIGIRKSRDYLWHDFNRDLEAFVCDLHQ